jgi:hypothetical protein
MLFIANILILLSLTVIAFQDFKQRQISWFLIPLALTGFVCKAVFYQNNVVHDFLFNASFILLQLICLTIYFSVKNKRFLNILDTYLGLGDILFLVVVCTVFSPVNFILFYLCSMILTLIGVLLYNSFATKRTADVPLAGSMAAILLVLVIVTIVFPGINFHNDTLFLTIMPH